ncbi:MAG: hypothetical protein GC185_11745 [Alphaproteobacteria bacterium]|nr:hypothetical protein [Alphaproteobacteria bacterium]
MSGQATTAAATESAAMPAGQNRGIISPMMDFLLLGGASLLLFPLAAVAFPPERVAAWHILPFMATLIMVLNYIINFPHFMYSYQLLYSDFADKVAGRVDPALRYRYIFAGIVVPIMMVLYFAAGVMRGDTLLLAVLPNLMFLTAGWHYAKQGFGMLVATSVYRKTFYTPVERKILLLNAHLVWVFAWVMFNTGAKDKVYLGIHFLTLGLPPELQASLGALSVIAAAALPVMFFMKYRREGRLPPLTGITAYVASIYLWVILRFGFGANNPIHPVVLLIPALHSLQYMAIVLKMKSNEARAGRRSSWRAFWGFTALGIVTGALAFMIVPYLLDHHTVYDKAVFGGAMYQFLFWIFINVHHYFIDNVIWRRENGEAKEYLFTPG